MTNIHTILCRTKVWQEKSLANLVNITKSPNFIRQTSSVLQLNYYCQYFNVFRQTLFAKLIFLFLYGMTYIHYDDTHTYTIHFVQQSISKSQCKMKQQGFHQQGYFWPGTVWNGHILIYMIVFLM